MDTPRCEACGLPAKLICFCTKSMLCECCIGKHLIDAPDLPHKPYLLHSEEANIYETHKQSLHAKEQELSVETKKRQALSQAIARKLEEEVKKVRALRPVVIEYVSMAVELVTKQLPELAEKLGREMLAACEVHEAVLESALAHFEGRADHSRNDAVRLLETFHSLAEVEAAEILTCTLQAGEMNVEQMMRTGLAFHIAVRKPATSRDQSPQCSGRKRPPLTSIAPNGCRKSAERRIATSRSKATQSLDLSVDHPREQPDLFNERMTKKLESLNQPKSPLSTGDFFKSGSPGDSSIVDACNGEDDFIKAESPSPAPPHQRSSLSGDIPFRKLPPDSGDRRFTRLQAARTRKALLRSCEKRRAVHSKRQAFRLPALSGDFFDSPQSPEASEGSLCKTPRELAC